MRTLPPHPSLEQYRKQAKDLLKLALSSDPASIEKLSSSARRSTRSSRFTLAVAQSAVARDHGFSNWPQFAARIASLTAEEPDLAIWRAAELAILQLDEQALRLLLDSRAELFKNNRPPDLAGNGLRPDYSSGSSRDVLMAAHDVASWDQIAELKMGLAESGSEIAAFEAAADAIVNGRLARLRSLLAAAPDLVLRRSIRKHHSTLLHYVGANGIEYYRQKTPKNIVQVTKLLLDAGADVNSHADMYGGGCTTLGLVATSVHPARAGRQNAIMELLVDRGASIGDAGSVNSCLANGRAAAAEWLAEHGAPLDLEGAAGVGRLDLVRACFQPNGGLKPGISSEQMSRAFAWTCEYGRLAVAEFLLEMGMDIAAPLRNHGQTGLHWAAHNAHPDLIRLLLKAGIPVEARDATFSATPLSWALHGWSDPPPGTPGAAYHEAVKALLAAGAEVEPAWLERADVQRDAKMLGLLRSALTSRT